MTAAKSSVASDSPEWLALVREKVESLRYGVVQIVVHDRKVTLIERTEKTRLDTMDSDAASRRATTA